MRRVENPILLDAPDFFETERLLVRVPRYGDSEAVYEAIHESLPELQPWMAWAHNPPRLMDVEADLRRDMGRFILREQFHMLAFRKEDQSFVANLSLHSIDWSVPMLEIGYWGRTTMGRLGYVTEAVRGLTDYAFTHFQAERMVIRCDIRNERSAAVARRLGYILEGIQRSDMREPDDTLSSAYTFSLLRDEWLNAPQR